MSMPAIAPPPPDARRVLARAFRPFAFARRLLARALRPFGFARGPLVRARRLLALAPALSLLFTACGSDYAKDWTGTMDTLSSGAVVVRNTRDPLWTPEERWRVVEDLRIGSAMGDGPDLFGRIFAFAVDAWGRIFVLDAQAQEIRLFDSEGTFVRKFGRRGEGPGEFTAALQVDLGRDGEVWVMDQPRAHVSIFDTSGTHLRGERVKTGVHGLGFFGGRFDPMGLYNVVIRLGGGKTRIVRFDPSFTPVDTIPVPEDPVERPFFETEGPLRFAPIPFAGSMPWRLSPAGTVWTLLTGRYELTEMTPGGEVLRRVTKEHEPVPVTAADRERAAEGLVYFTTRGGRIDWSQVPESRPPTESFFFDDDGNVWVERAPGDSEDPGRSFDIFDPEGRYLGMLPLPFSLRGGPDPVVREGVLYGVTSDELDVAYVVRARIEKP